MFCRVNSIGISGMEGYQVRVEVDVSNGLPGFSMVGYLGSEVREARDRVLTAIKNSGFQCPPRKITVNLSPANIKKEGTAFDLPIAVGVLGAYGWISTDELRQVVIAGELGLNGEVKGIRGALTMAGAAGEMGMTHFFLPEINRREGQAAGGIPVTGVSCLRELTDLLNRGEKDWNRLKQEEEESWREEKPEVDYQDIVGQPLLKRAAEIAAAGMHNLLLMGPAGTGKSMTARRIPTIMPPMTMDERREISKIYSICGLLPDGQPLIGARPFRSPHHSATVQAIAGGGRGPRPGEVSLATGGVLFLDELPEFPRSVIELLRQPLEDRSIVVARVSGAYRFPADFMLVAASNPCPCGFYPDRSRCHCSENQVRRYLNRISRPILDRMDLIAEAGLIPYEEIAARGEKKEESSAVIRQRVEAAWQIQKERFCGTEIRFNSRMGHRELEEFCALGSREERLMRRIYESEEMSGRGRDRLLKVARTIADLEGGGPIQESHLMEAAGYRSGVRRYWGGGYGD
ncbi:MAG TPA: YifB family Mg chelatase-like AAA ATPase [Candidatus Lachnoclostridium stercoripullorum]|uniref:YifB family Mg chelatase-like AAA ATPase n=1 Tax=Candidatus Lachnoclostridium stercoripullorum TaxID=2838635 RepID=A0A9D1W4I3_9FIRM|nr:YifB family Mg chelatase-like AAA ATPase [Candidatus Lachnoclostridium stercoripullorum]